MNLLEMNVVFKGLAKREGGEFTNERGQKVTYDESYLLKFDEEVNGDVFERRLKFPITNKQLANKLKDLDIYSKIVLICDVQLYTSSAKIVPVDLGE